jgi:hypothetical protein
MGQRVFSGSSRFILGAIFIIIVSLASCQKTNESGDTQNPVINVISTIPQLSAVEICGAISPFTFKISTEQSITLNLKLTDDVALSEMKIDIHHNFDCHTHKSLKNQVVWNLIEIISLDEKKEVEMTKILTPPSNVVPGNYHLTLFCVDMQGKEATRMYYDIVIFDPIDTQKPQITISEPTENETFAQNSTITISGKAKDDQKMGGGFVEISIKNAQDLEFSVINLSIPQEVEKEFSFETSYTFPPFFQPGDYQIIIKAADWRNNQANEIRNITIIP